MYSEDDLRAAVSAGAITVADADGIRLHVASLRNAPAADEETFRLVSGFNDIFVSIAAALALFGIGTLVGRISPGAAGAAIAVTAWVLAEFFTRKRRMALPSILLLLAFHIAVFTLAIRLLGLDLESIGRLVDRQRLNSLDGTAYSEAATLRILQFKAIGVCALAALANLAHWFRFRVPLAIATATGSSALAGFVAITLLHPEVGTWMLWLLLAFGLALFAFAMAWDLRDPQRTKGQADVAFWLHLQASPMIVHSVFALIAYGVGLKEENALFLALVAIAIYAVFAVIALIVDRRAILVSALIYFVIAMIYLLRTLGEIELNFAISAVLIGATLLLLSAYWQKLRAVVLQALPSDWAERLPATTRIVPGSAAHV